MKKFPLAIALVMTAGIGGNVGAATVTLSGTVRDFCAPDIAPAYDGDPGCTQLSDFEGATPGVVTGMVNDTLTGGLPTAGANIVAGASSVANFAKWYTDSPGFNLSQPISIDLTETAPGSGVFTYSSSSFFPIDGALYGDQGRPHNYHFTLHLEGLLSFDDADGLTDLFSFTGDDDLWVFVDGKLALDLGGVHSAASASFSEADLVALGLAPNTQYALDIFFAERHTTESNFNITTALSLAPPNPIPLPAAAPLFLSALAGLGFVARRRKQMTA